MKSLILAFVFMSAQSSFANIPQWPNWLSLPGSDAFGFSPPLKIQGKRVDVIRFGLFSFRSAKGAIELGRLSAQGEWIDSGLGSFNPVFGSSTYDDVYLRIGEQKFVIDARGEVRSLKDPGGGSLVSHVVELASEVDDTFIRQKDWGGRDKSMELVYKPDEEFPQFLRLKETLTVERYGEGRKLVPLKFNIIRLERPNSNRLTDASDAYFGILVNGKFQAVKSSDWRYTRGTDAPHLMDKYPAGLIFSMDPRVVFPSHPDKRIILRSDGKMKVDERLIETQPLLFKRRRTFIKGRTVCEKVLTRA